MRSEIRFCVIVVAILLGVAACSGAQPGGKDAPLMDSRGTLKGDRFVFRGPPRFRFKLPSEATVVERVRLESQVVRVQTPEMGTIEGSVVLVEKAFKLESAGRFYLSVLEQVVGRDHVLESNEPIKLKDGTRAYETRIRWVLDFEEQSVEILTVLVSAREREWWVFVTAHAGAEAPDISWVPRTLRLE